MNRIFNSILGWLGRVIQIAKVRKATVLIVVAAAIFQLYFVRELLAAELLFAGAFAVLLAIGGLIYLVGVVGEHGLDWAEASVRVAAETARRGYAGLEEISRKPFRAPGSESAQ
jgi:predicted membrane channel-forming protein YqfA (hemolysin III family)